MLGLCLWVHRGPMYALHFHFSKPDIILWEFPKPDVILWEFLSGIASVLTEGTNISVLSDRRMRRIFLPYVTTQRTSIAPFWTDMCCRLYYLICRTVPCLLSTVPWLSLFRPLLMSQYLKYTCTDRQASYLYKVGLEYETVKPRRNFNLYTLMRAILLQISRWSGMRGLKTGYGLE